MLVTVTMFSFFFFGLYIGKYGVSLIAVCYLLIAPLMVRGKSWSLGFEQSSEVKNNITCNYTYDRLHRLKTETPTASPRCTELIPKPPNFLIMRRV